MNKLRLFLAAPLLLGLSGCATLDGEDGSGQQSAPMETVAVQEKPLATSAEALVADKNEEPQEAIVYRGTDRHVRMPAKQEAVHFIGEDVSLNFEQAPLSEVTHAIMGDILKLDYIVDHPIQGQVTLRTRTPIPRDQLLGVLESLLKSNNTIMIRGADGRYLITGTARGTKLSPSVSNAADAAAGYSTIIVSLQYISASNMAEILKPVADESAFVRVDRSRNLLMLAGTRLQLDGWLDIVATFDVDQLKGMSVGLYPLENSSVDEVSTALEALLAGGEGGSNMKDMIRIVPVQRLNSILVVTPRAHYLDTLQTWIERLDEAHYSAYDRRLYVYPVQNTTASRLADLINRIYSGGGSTQQNNSRDAGGVAPGMSPESLGSSGGGGNSFGKSGSSFGSGKKSGSGISSVTMSDGVGEADASSVLAEVRVVADEENNALMIYASAMQYKIIEDALEQLDVVATQVIIEASIIEVSLTDELSYGLEWTFKNGLGNDYSGTGFLSKTSELAAKVPGFSYTVANSMGDVSAVLNALAQESLLNIISTPSVMVLDNHSAYIHVGQQVPVLDSRTESLTAGDRITQSVSYRDTGVKLEVTPSVNAGGLVTMDVKQSVTDLGELDPATSQNTFLERNIESRVAVRSGESVVLGGLIRENATTASQGVPWLHSIPVVGSLFGTDEKKNNRTELLVIITPRALYNESELRDVGEEMRSRVRNLELIDVKP